MSIGNDLDQMDPVKRDIMEATYKAVSEHGYGDLTIQHIADEFENSKTLTTPKLPIRSSTLTRFSLMIFLQITFEVHAPV
ncbi:hypothetical protein EL22_27700 [Halostagnicola sp. A56]|nr:hypothetical protein EL22_27700 [Halostagnicola sp. A56]